VTRWTPARVREALGLPATAQDSASAGRSGEPPAKQGISQVSPSGVTEPTFTRVLTDTRSIEPGALFVALVGERYDGHDYLPAAVAAGATGVVVREGTEVPAGVAAFPVRDTLEAFGLLARARRREIAGPVIAVTGTNGKTSTKEMLAVALGTRFVTYATRANLNNLVGVPLTILESPPETEALVVEAGANLPGEIARYREIIRPDVVVITNAVAGHLEGFGSMEGVLEEKLSLSADVELAVVGVDPPALAEGARRRARRAMPCGSGRSRRSWDSTSTGSRTR
jgi:UDP-N-acetylmuramoyl-tripeptide--D-alanyl-D-alanine ligase